MKKHSVILTLAALACLGLMAGCSEEGANPAPELTGSDNYDTIDFNALDGGLTDTDEAIAFDDDGLKALLVVEEADAVDDPLSRDPQVLELEERSRNRENYSEDERPTFTYARLRWGMLRGPDDNTRVERPCGRTDWTGTLRVDRGILVVKRKIRFEWPADHVVFPRLDRQTVAFVSHTWCGLDGLVIQIIEPPVDDTLQPETPNMLYIDTPNFKGEFPVSELADTAEIFDVDDLGNRFQIDGFRLGDIEVCPKGFLSGRFRNMQQDRPNSVTVDRENGGERHGAFAGAWYSLNGRITGFMRGGYGVNAEGERVFVGKFIGRKGRFMGLIRGGWEPAGNEGDLASFRGQWVTRSGNIEGLLGGEAHPVEGYPGGFYTGRWTTLCDEEAETQVQ